MTLILGYWIIVAGFAGNQDAGIYVYRLDAQTGKLTQISHVTKGVTRPLFLTSNQKGDHLYVTDMVSECAGVQGGAVAAYRFDSQTGALVFLNRQPSYGKVPCYVDITKNNRFATVANYNDGHVSVLTIEADGRLGKVTANEKYQGQGGDPKRQSSSHPHCFRLSPDGEFALAVDLGTDRIMVHRLDKQTGKLTDNREPYFSTPVASGPRHLVFHPNQTLAFLATELDNTVLSLRWTVSKGVFELLDRQSMLPVGKKSLSYGADIQVHPNGHFLYASNRGHDSLVIMSIDDTTGKLTTVGHQSTQGAFPRSFAIDPLGQFLIVANEKSDQLVTFKIDAKTGLLTFVSELGNVPTPTSVIIIPVAGK